MAQTMAEFLIEQGELRAKREDVLKLLHIRFDPVPDTILNKISTIRNILRLDTLFEKIATAQTLNEIDWDK